MNILEVLLGQIPEAIYFAIFMILVKNLKKKRILFILLMIIEYLLLKQFLHYTVWFQILYTFITFLILKVLYKEYAQITDIFTFTIASICLMISCIVLTLPNILFGVSQAICVALNRIFIFVMLYVFRKRMPMIQKLYKKLWNRNDKVAKKMKSTTFRSLNVVIFNFMFYVVNICMLYAIYFNSK